MTRCRKYRAARDEKIRKAVDATVTINDTIGRFVGHAGRSNLMDSVASLFSDVIDDIGSERRQVSASLTTKFLIGIR